MKVSITIDEWTVKDLVREHLKTLNFPNVPEDDQLEIILLSVNGEIKADYDPTDC